MKKKRASRKNTSRTDQRRSHRSVAFQRSFLRPVWVEIDHDNLKHNLSEMSRLAPTCPVLAVVKANAYGHGLVPVGKTMSACKARFLGITSVEESLELKAAGIKTPALILGNIYPFESLEIAIRDQVRVTVASPESARICDQFARKLGRKVYAHAKIDTGMGRIGVNADNAVEFVRKIGQFKSIVLEGLYSHYSSVMEDPGYTKMQIGLFSRLVTGLRSQGIRIPYVHCANSATILRHPEAHYSLIRPGISLYGVSPASEDRRVALKPVLTWKSRVIFLKEVPAYSSISYARTFVSKRRSRIATASFGYADGYRRNLSNRGLVLVNGHRVPVIGRITMDMTMLDVTDVPRVNVGDEVTLIGSQGSERVSAEDVAGWSGTSPYEVFCGISTRVPRVQVGGS